MKKYIAFTLVTIMLVSTLFGCTLKKEITNDTPREPLNETPNETPSDKYKTAITDYSDAVGINGLRVEYEIRDYEGFENKKGPNNAVYKHQGKTTAVNLSESEGMFLRRNYYPVYGNYEIWFNPDGKLERFSLVGSVEKPKEVKCSEEDAIEVAKKFMSDIINVSEYTVSVSKVEDIWNLYTVYFHKYVDGIKTTENACVSVTFDGEFCDYVADMLDQFTGVTKNPFDMDKVKETVYDRLEELTNCIKDKYDKIEYQDEEFSLTKLKDGSLAILYTGEIHCIEELGEYDLHSGERIEMLVMQ